MEFENFSSVKARIGRSTPVVIRSSTWAFTFSTPASANERRALLRAQPHDSGAPAAGRRTPLDGPEGRPPARLRAPGRWRLGRGGPGLSRAGVLVRSTL